MTKRTDTQWFLYNLAIIGRSPEVYDTKEEAVEAATKYNESKENPLYWIDEENRCVDYRGKVYL